MGTYLPFEGIALADTFELFEGQQRHIMFTKENTERVERQKAVGYVRRYRQSALQHGAGE